MSGGGSPAFGRAARSAAHRLADVICLGVVRFSGWPMFRLVVSELGVIGLLLGIILTTAALSVAPRVLAQAAPSFEVASIRPVTGSQGQSVMFLPTGRFTALNLTLRDLIALAYGAARQPLPAARVIGGPDWMASQRFDVEAIAAGPVAPDPAFDGRAGRGRDCRTRRAANGELRSGGPKAFRTDASGKFAEAEIPEAISRRVHREQRGEPVGAGPFGPAHGSRGPDDHKRP